MRSKRRSPGVILAALVLLVLPSAALAQLAIYAEGAYTATDLAVYLYADISGTPLCSYGVTLYYDATKLTVTSATKNQAVWYLGTSAAPIAYVNPDTSTAGRIVFIGGKLDTGNPTAGVTGTRVLLGTARFNRVAGTDTNFGIALALGRTHPPYDNIVTTGGVVRDDTTGWGPVIIRQRGDVNGDGYITGADNSALKYYLVNGGVAHPWMDCNGDGLITGADNSCIKYLLTH
ncbi:MAG: hypothetical protein HPY67_09195 [Syntrophaceae bacterium]|nr:hypothetical protein [Syntrophaceae bacterium]